MTFDEILATVGDIIREVVDADDATITSGTTAPEVPGWDSLSNVQVIVAVERRFKIRFRSSEITSFRNVGEMCAAIEQRLSA